MIVTKTFPAARSLNNVLDELFKTFPSDLGSDTKSASGVAVNIVESENGYNTAFNAPGRNKEDFKISVDNGLLTVSYEKASTEAAGQKFVRREFTSGNFKRTFSLDEKVSAEGIEAKYENGILNVFIPKKEEVKNAPKHISIQ